MMMPTGTTKVKNPQGQMERDDKVAEGVPSVVNYENRGDKDGIVAPQLRTCPLPRHLPRMSPA